MTMKFMGRKLGMMQLFDDEGNVIPCTVIETEPLVVTQIKRKETDGYNAIQLGFGKVVTKDPRTVQKRVSKPQRVLFEKAGIVPRKHLFEVQVDNLDQYSVGQEITLDVLDGVAYVDVTGQSKGKGFQGLMKLCNYAGGPGAHGSGFHRHAGSTGMRSTPGRTLPNHPMPSRMGGDQVTLQNLKLVSVDTENQTLIVKGAIPGARGTVLTISQAVKKVAK